MKVRPNGQVSQPRNPFTGNGRVKYYIAIVAHQPAADRGGFLFIAALVLPEIQNRTLRIAEDQAGVALEVLRTLRDTMCGPVAGGRTDEEACLPDAPMHEVCVLGPAEHDEHVDGARFGVGQSIDAADVDLDVGIACVKSRQRGKDAMLRKKRRRADREPTAWTGGCPAYRFIGGSKLLEKRLAGVKVALAIRSKRHPAHRAVEQVRAEVALECSDELGNGGNAYFELPRSAGEAVLLCGGNEILQCAKLIHGAFSLNDATIILKPMVKAEFAQRDIPSPRTNPYNAVISFAEVKMKNLFS